MADTELLSAGTAAPDFELRGTVDGEVDTYRLGELTAAGNWVLLTFYAFDFNPICTTGMCALRDAEFFDFYDNLVVLGVSGDGIHSHKEFADRHDIRYPLLSDTGRDVAEAYGVLKPSHDGLRQVHKRAVFIIDDTQTVRFATEIDADEEADDIDIDLGSINDELRALRG